MLYLHVNNYSLGKHKKHIKNEVLGSLVAEVKDQKNIYPVQAPEQAVVIILI